jgi:hypothetical protein
MISALATFVKAVRSFLIVFAVMLTVLMFIWFLFPRAPEGIVRLNEVMPDPASAGWSDGFVELYNGGKAPASLDGWSIKSGGESVGLFGEIEPGGFKVAYGGPTAGDREVRLVNSGGALVDAYAPVGGAGASVGRFPDGFGSWNRTGKPTPGMPNAYEPPQATSSTLPYAPVPECMRAEFDAQGSALAEAGFSGGADYFCSEFKSQMLEADPTVRGRIEGLSDPALKAEIVRAVAERSVARAREERTIGLVVSDSELFDGIAGLLGGELPGGSLDGEIAKMNMKFRRMLFDVLVNGTKSERSEMRLQFNYYLERREAGNSTLVVDPDELRVMLSRGDSVQEMLVKLGT